MGDESTDAWGPAGAWDDGKGTMPPVEMNALVKPPRRYLVTASVVVLVSVVLLPFTPVRLHILGWFLASLLTVALLTVYTATDQRSRLSAWYSPEPSEQTARACLGALGLGVALVHAWYIAYHFAS
jgi:hypothetical protein